LFEYLFSKPAERTSEPSETEQSSDASSSTASEATQQDTTKEDVALSSQAEFLLFLGDFIYADVPVYIGDNKEAYRRLYRRNYLSDSFRKIYERLREVYLLP
jgi:alkaline phosphatase D